MSQTAFTYAIGPQGPQGIQGVQGNPGDSVWTSTISGLTPSNPSNGINIPSGSFRLGTSTGVLLSAGGVITANAGLPHLNDVSLVEPAGLNTADVLSWNGSVWTNTPITSISAGASVNYYLHNELSDITVSGVQAYQLTANPPDVGDTILSAAAGTGTDALIGQWCTPSGIPGTTILNGGLWEFPTYAYYDVLNPVLRIRVFSLSVSGVLTPLFSVDGPSMTASVALYTISTVQPAFNLATTDRILIKYFNHNPGAGTRTVYMHIEGTQYASFVRTPIVVTHNQLTGLQGGTSNQYFHLTSSEYTGTGTGNFVRTSSPSITTPTLVGDTTAGTINGQTISAAANFTNNVTVTSTFKAKGLNHEFGDGTSTSRIYLRGAAGNTKDITYQSGSSNRWSLRTTGSETGSGIGSDLILNAFDDSGNSLGNYLIFVRANGSILVGQSAAITYVRPSVFQITTESGIANAAISARRFFDDTQGAAFELVRARGTAASPVALNVGDTIGSIIFGGYYASTWRTQASIDSWVTSNVGGTGLTSGFNFVTYYNGSPSTMLQLDPLNSPHGSIAAFNANLLFTGAYSVGDGGGTNVDPVNVWATTKFSTSDSHIYFAAGDHAAVLTSKSRTTGSFIISDDVNYFTNTPHGLLLVNRHGPTTYTGTDQLRAIRAIITSDSYQATQPDYIYGVEGTAEIGIPNSSGLFAPNVAMGVNAHVSVQFNGTVVSAIGAEMWVKNWTSTPTVTTAVGGHFRRHEKVSGTITNAWGALFDEQVDGSVSNAAIRFGTLGRLDWNGDTSVYRSGTNTLTVSGYLQAPAGLFMGTSSIDFIANSFYESGGVLRTSGGLTTTLLLQGLDGAQINNGLSTIIASNGTAFTIKNTATFSGINYVKQDFYLTGVSGVSIPYASFVVSSIGISSDITQFDIKLNSGTGFQTALSVNSSNMTLSRSLIFGLDNIYDIGAVGATRPRNLYLSGGITTPAFKMTTGAVSGYALVSDSSGNGTWTAISGTGGGVTPADLKKYFLI